MEEKVHSEGYPYNLLTSVRGQRMLELPPTLTRDVQAGLAYALFTLEETEQNVLYKKYHMGITLSSNLQEIELKALKKLRHPSRWDYIRYGIVGYTKKKSEEAQRRGYTQGYQDGYVVGLA